MNHKFWSTQPVIPKNNTNTNNYILTDEEYKLLTSQKEFKLPNIFKWCLIDIANQEELNELSVFLNKYYIEDSNSKYRLNYSSEFLNFCLNYNDDNNKNIYLGIRTTDTKSLVAFISGIFINMSINKNTIQVAEINFLCVYPKLRQKRLAPVLIKEITRRISLLNCKVAVYTDANLLPGCICNTQYYHRLINILKLVDIGFTSLDGLTMEQFKRKMLLPKNILNKNLIKLEKKYVNETCKLLNTYLERYSCYQVFSKQEFKHLFLNNNLVYSYVLTNNDKIVDFISYYILPTKVLNNPKHQAINTAYLFYYTNNTNNLSKLVKDILIICRNNKIDVFNCLDIMENKTILDDLRFMPGTGKLHYYLYNWNTNLVDNNQLAKLLF